MMSDFSVRSLTEDDYGTWCRFVAEAPSGSIYAHPSYLATLSAATDGAFEIIGAFKGNELVGGQPLFVQQSRLGSIVSSRLLLYYHGPVIREYGTKMPSERTSKQLAVLQALEQHLRTLSCIHLHLQVRHPIFDLRPFLSAGWQVRPSYSYLVNIADIRTAWGRVDQNLRRLIGRAERSGVVFTDDDDFDSFYRLHLDTHRRKGAPVYLDRDAFHTLFRRLKALDFCRLFHARLPDGTSIAGQLVLTGPHAVSHTVCAAADAAHLSIGATPFLRWKSFEALSALGYAANDLTDAALNNVTRFKSQLGGDLVTNWAVTRPVTVRYRLSLGISRSAGIGRGVLRRAARLLGRNGQGL